MPPESITLNQARRIALKAQGFGARHRVANPTWRQMGAEVSRMGLLQIDSINIIERSHYLPLFSRLGTYDKARLDEKTFHPKRRALFEYWAHEASFLPFEFYPLLKWRMAEAEQGTGMWRGMKAFARKNKAFIEEIVQEITTRGPLRAGEFKGDHKRKGEMWEWHDGKTALEYLFWTGRVSAATRINFERRYDLTERVIPADIFAAPTPSREDAHRALLTYAARAHGIGTEQDLRDYFRLPAKETKARLAELVEEGALIPTQIRGWKQPAYLDPQAHFARRIEGSALLTPFDPLIWERNRAQRLFGFHYRIEIYTPAPKRKHGYYVLPFLLDDRLVARVDLKADRQGGVLRVLGAFGEAGIETGRVTEELHAELLRLAAWLRLSGLAFGSRGDLMKGLKQLTPR